MSTGAVVGVCALLGLGAGVVADEVARRVPAGDGDGPEWPRRPRRTLLVPGVGVLWAATAARFGWAWELPAFLLLAATLAVLSVIDVGHAIVPNRILGPVTLAGVALLGLGVLGPSTSSDLGRAVVAGAVAFGSLLAVHAVSPRGLGLGDVKLGYLLGLFLGWLSWGHLALGLFLGFLFGAGAGILLVVTGRRRPSDRVPFVPFLAAGTLVAVWWGRPLLDAYLTS